MKCIKKNGLIVPLALLMLAPLAFVLQKWAFAHPVWIEGVFSSKIYPILAQLVSFLFGWLPFSAGEWIVVGSVVWIPLLVVWFYRRARRTNGRMQAVLDALIRLAAIACCGYFVFMCLCGFNYARLPYAQIAGYDASPVSQDELKSVCALLIEETNTLRAQVNEDADGVFLPSDDLQSMAARTQANYALAAEDAPWLGGRYSRAKRIALSQPLAYTQITGIFFPFTVEANINTIGSTCMFACTIAHEAAHQRGFMREDEANFIAWYVCRGAENIEDQYSGAMLALIHATNALYEADRDFYYMLRAAFSPGVERDLAAHNALWNQYEGAAAELQDQVNDAYLRSNNQEDGVRSYGRMVDLLVGYYRARGAV